MNVMEEVGARLRRSDMLQTMVIAFVALSFVLAIRWPIGSGDLNEVWFVLAPVRIVLLSVAALVFGAIWGVGRDPDETPRSPSQHSAAPLEVREGRFTLLALWTMTALTWPFEVASHAASYPNVGFAWAAALPFLAVTAFFALGAWFGAAGRRARASAITPLLLLVVIGSALWLETVIGVNFVNPALAVTGPSPAFVAVSAALSVSLAPLLLRRPVTEDEV